MSDRLADEQFTLGPLDSAVIFGADGTMTLKVSLEDSGDGLAPVSAMQAARVVALFNNPEALKLVDDRLEVGIAAVMRPI